MLANKNVDKKLQVNISVELFFSQYLCAIKLDLTIIDQADLFLERNLSVD